MKTKHNIARCLAKTLSGTAAVLMAIGVIGCSGSEQGIVSEESASEGIVEALPNTVDTAANEQEGAADQTVIENTMAKASEKLTEEKKVDEEKKVSDEKGDKEKIDREKVKKYCIEKLGETATDSEIKECIDHVVNLSDEKGDKEKIDREKVKKYCIEKLGEMATIPAIKECMGHVMGLEPEGLYLLPPDLKVTLTGSLGEDGNANYQLIIRNARPVVARGVSLYLNAWMEVSRLPVSIGVIQGITCTTPGSTRNRLDCLVGEVAPNATVEKNFTVTPQGYGTLKLFIMARSAVADLTPEDNKALVSTIIGNNRDYNPGEGL